MKIEVLKIYYNTPGNQPTNMDDNTYSVRNPTHPPVIRDIIPVYLSFSLASGARK